MKFFPILSTSEAKDFEQSIFRGDESLELGAIQLVANGIVNLFTQNFSSYKNNTKRVLFLLGKGHNAADILCAFNQLSEFFGDKTLFYFCLCHPKDSFRNNTKKLYDTFVEDKKNVIVLDVKAIDSIKNLDFEFSFEAIAGMNFKQPISEDLKHLAKIVNAMSIASKISIDVPFGVSEDFSDCLINADYTYACGIVKKSLFLEKNKESVGRIRFINIGFFDSDLDKKDLFCAKESLTKLIPARKSFSDKRSFGHLFIIGGSRKYKGAVMLNTKAGLRSSVGLVSVFLPESLSASFAAVEPSAIFVDCAETPLGGISLETLSQFKQLSKNCTGLLIGSGLTDESECKALVCEIIKNSTCPIVLDADAIFKESLELLKGRKNAIITPHIGEFLRIAKDDSDELLLALAKEYSITVVLKSNIMRCCDGEKIVRVSSGTPALSRGGSGDILSALIAGLIANKSLNLSPLEAASYGAFILGNAGEKASQIKGECFLTSSDIINFL